MGLRLPVRSKIIGAEEKDVNRRMIIATNGFVKNRKKTPRCEIEPAKRRRDDYHRRKERFRSGLTVGWKAYTDNTDKTVEVAVMRI